MPGAIFSTLGMVSPSLIIVSVIAMFLQQFMDNQTVQHAVAGIKIVVCALMLNTVVTMGKKTLVNRISVIMCIAGFAAAMFTPVPTVLLVLMAGITGIILYKAGRMKP